MSALRNILAATDFSEAADNGLARATILSHDVSADLIFVHVFNRDASDRLLQWGIEKLKQPDLEKIALDALGERLSGFVDEFGQSGQTIGAEVRCGALIPTLNTALVELKADLLVCAARGESLFRHHLLGSTALRMLHTARIPVLVVKSAPSATYGKVLLAADFSEGSMTGARWARAVAPDASMSILNVTESPFEHAIYVSNIEEVLMGKYRDQAKRESETSLRELRDQIEKSLGVSLTNDQLITHQGDAAHTIVEQAQALGCDLIVMGRHGTGVLQERLLGSVTKQVLEASPVDVLVV